MLSKIISTIQDRANAVSANTFLNREKCSECLPSPFAYSCQVIWKKTRESFIIWTRKIPADNCPISSPRRLLIQKLFWPSDEGFKIASCHRRRSRGAEGAVAPPPLADKGGGQTVSNAPPHFADLVE